MGLFGAIVRTVVNTALLPVAVAKDVITLGGDTLEDPVNGKTNTEKQIERLKNEADDD